MKINKALLAGAAVVGLAAPAVALADPYWGSDNGYYQDRDGDHQSWDGDHRSWDDNDWRNRQWRDHDWREHHRYGSAYGWRWGYRPHCWLTTRGHYTWYGQYVYRQVRVCR